MPQIYIRIYDKCKRAGKKYLFKKIILKYLTIVYTVYTFDASIQTKTRKVMKTVKKLVKAYSSIIESGSNDPDVVIAQRNIYLAIERLKYSNSVIYFQNEQGDYSLVENLNEENEVFIGYTKSEDVAKTLVFALNQK